MKTMTKTKNKDKYIDNDKDKYKYKDLLRKNLNIHYRTWLGTLRRLNRSLERRKRAAARRSKTS